MVLHPVAETALPCLRITNTNAQHAKSSLATQWSGSRGQQAVTACQEQQNRKPDIIDVHAVAATATDTISTSSSTRGPGAMQKKHWAASRTSHQVHCKLLADCLEVPSADFATAVGLVPFCLAAEIDSNLQRKLSRPSGAMAAVLHVTSQTQC